MPTFKGQHFKALGPSNPLSPGETEAVEKAAGMSFPRIRRMLETCVCDHAERDHVHKLDSGDVDPENTACEKCDCPELEADASTKVLNAMSWVAIRRAVPTLTLAEYLNISPDDIQPDEESPDPTDPTPTSPDIGALQV